MKNLLYIDFIICNFWSGTKLVDMYGNQNPHWQNALTDHFNLRTWRKRGVGASRWQNTAMQSVKYTCIVPYKSEIYDEGTCKM